VLKFYLISILIGNSVLWFYELPSIQSGFDYIRFIFVYFIFVLPTILSYIIFKKLKPSVAKILLILMWVLSGAFIGIGIKDSHGIDEFELSLIFFICFSLSSIFYFLWISFFNKGQNYMNLDSASNAERHWN